MTVDNIIVLGRDITHLNSDQVSDAKALICLNAVYHDCVAGITQHVGEDFFLDVWVADAVSGQADGEYAFPAASATVAGMRKLRQLSVKVRSDDTYYRKARQTDWRALANTWDWYLANQSMDDPIYVVADSSFFLAPNFTDETVGAAGNGQLKIRGVKSAIDLVAAGSESTVLVPREFHAKVLAKGLAPWLYRHVGKDSEAAAAEAEYEREKLKMFTELSDRDVSIGQGALPSDEDMQY